MPRFSALLGDDIDDTSRGIAAVESTGCTFHYLYALHIAHVQSGEVNVIHCLPCQPLAVDEEQHALSAESVHVEMPLLVHGVGELYPRHLFLHEVFHVGRIRLLYVCHGDEPCSHRCVFQEFGCASACHHNVVQQVNSVSLQHIFRRSSVSLQHIFRRSSVSPVSIL